MKKLIVFCCLGFGLLAKAESTFGDGSGLNIGVNADIYGNFGLGDSPDALGRLDVREAELIAYAPVDWLFDGVVSLAAHREADGQKFELHEAYIGSSKLIPRSRFRVGQFFLGVGRLNQFHRHDWPFVSAPNVQKNFFAEEAASDSGFEYSWLTPLPFYLDVTAGITNGWVYGHSDNQGVKAVIPTHYLRAATFFSMSEQSQAQVGLNYVGRKASDNTVMTMLGLDFTAKWKEYSQLNFFLQSEVWYRDMHLPGQNGEKAIGLYVFPNLRIANNLYAGCRFDFYSVLNLRDAFGAKISSYDYAVVPTISYKTSEFATVRLAMNFAQSRQAGQTLSTNKIIETQAVFILGAHPAHDF